MDAGTEIRPQAGPQTEFLRSSADIVVYGGAAGGGKTWALLLEPLRHVHNGRFSCVVFRRTSPQIRNQGGLWDESLRLYPALGATPHLTDLRWTFPSGATVRFAHMQHEKDKFAWQGSQVPLICFDELTHFSEGQFLYMLSRNRSLSGVRPYMRATCNPDADSWAKGLLAPWVDDEHGEYPYPAGALRWMTMEGGSLRWVGEDWRDEHGQGAKSVTFVPARVFDNGALLEANPEYLANLRALPLVEKERLLHGNWKVRPAAGKIFNRAWFEVVEVAPAGGRAVRFWDFAGTTKKSKGDDPDWTVGCLVRKLGPLFYVCDVARARASWPEVRRLVRATALQDGRGVTVAHEVEPGSSGKAVASEIAGELAGWSVRGVRPEGDKAQRASAAASQALAGHVALARGAWNGEFLAELHGFPDLAHDDQVDAFAGAVNTCIELGEVGGGPALALSRAEAAQLLGE